MNKFICYIIMFMLTILLFAISIFSISQAGPTDINDNVIYIRGGSLRTALYLLKLNNNYNIDTTIPYNRESYYKFNLANSKLINTNRHDYLLNDPLVAPINGKWFLENMEYIIDSQGAKVANLSSHIIEYVWSPTGDKIAYTTGENVLDETPPSHIKPGSTCKGPCPDGLWIYDLKSHSKKRINAIAYFLAWPSFDNNLYFDTTFAKGNIMRYHPDTGNLEKTPYKDLNFSPNGKYYFDCPHGDEGEPCKVYQREPHQELKERSYNLDNISNFMGYHIWLADDHSLFLSAKDSAISFIVYGSSQEFVGELRHREFT